MLLASSTVMTPSLPTLSMAWAMKSPISWSPLAEMAPTWAISFCSLVGVAIFFSWATTAATLASMPRLISMGLEPAATSFTPSRKMAWASTVAVVVPSPATSEVLDATSRTICAPMFSNLHLTSTSLATVTPSLVMTGAPKDFSISTLRPLGPRVTFTALARVLTPVSIFSRALPPYFKSFAAMTYLLYLRVVLSLRSRPGCHPRA